MVVQIHLSMPCHHGRAHNLVGSLPHMDLPVVIFSTTEFDATTIDPTTVTLAEAQIRLRGKGTPMASTQDVNDDDLLGLVVHVETEAA